MAGIIKRQEALEKLDQLYRACREQIISSDPSKPVKDGKFYEWEELADEFSREMTSGVIEVLAQMSEVAELKDAGHCPYCHSRRVRWLGRSGQRERTSKHGPVVVPRQVSAMPVL